MKGQDTSELFFDNVSVPRQNLLGGEEGKGFGQWMKELAWERLMIGITGAGACDAMLANTLGYVKERRSLGPMWTRVYRKSTGASEGADSTRPRQVSVITAMRAKQRGLPVLRILKRVCSNFVVPK